MLEQNFSKPLQVSLVVQEAVGVELAEALLVQEVVELVETVEISELVLALQVEDQAMVQQGATAA